MMTHRVLISVYVGLCAFAQSTGAQRGAVPVRGVVFDSLRGKPLSNAFVTIAGVSGASATDSHGRFRFDSVAPGVYTVTAQHPVLDSIGLSGLATRTTIEAGGHDVQLAVPSFETLWRSSCPGKVPRDSGIVFGSVRSAMNGRPVADAAVQLSWADLLLDSKRSVVQRQFHIDTRTNARGGYAVCAVPPRTEFSMRAANDTSASGLIVVAPIEIRVRRFDLLIGPVTSAARQSGAIVGLVTDPQGQLISGARVLLESLPEARTDADGHFRLDDVPAGTRQLQVISIGVAPAFAVADVLPRDSVAVSVRLEKAVTLSAVRSMAAGGNRVFAVEFDARRRSGFGYSRDSTEIARYPRFPNALRDVPGLNVREMPAGLTITVSNEKGGFCEPEVLIDGASAAFGHLIDLHPDEVAALEVYVRSAHIPPRFVPTGIQPQCGMILVWTKYGFRNR
jgi:Carboxypeptidase regulatory-like domain